MAYRGCMSDLGTDGRAYCIENFAQCNICSSRACNSNPLEFEDKLKCVKCGSDENFDCNVVDDSVTATECAPTTMGYENECYIYYDGSVTRRGCLYEAPADIHSECSDIFSDTCTVCNQTDCNRTPIINDDLIFNAFHSEEGKMETIPRSCYKCDSTNDPNCVSELNSEMVKICPNAEEDLGCFHMVTGKLFFSNE